MDIRTHLSTTECPPPGSNRGYILLQGMAPDTLTPCKLRAPSASSEILDLLATLDPARATSTGAAADGAHLSTPLNHMAGALFA